MVSKPINYFYMEEITNDFILVVEDKDAKKLSVVSSVDAQGNIKTVEPLDANSGQFMRFNAKDSLFRNFMDNFSRQFKDPSHTGLYRMVADEVENSVKVLQQLLQKPEENGDSLKLVRVNLEEYAPGEQHGKVDENRIDWDELAAIGLNRERLEESGNLEKMLAWGKSDLMPISVPFGDKTIYTEARLAFRENADGNLTLAIHTIRKEPRLDFTFMGVQFSDEDKRQLRETGNLGRVAEVTPKNGEPFMAFISVDPQTNELIALKADRIRIPAEIKGVELSPEQRADLADGKAVKVEGMLSRKGTAFNAAIQVNAEKRGIEFRFGKPPKLSERLQDLRQEQRKGIPGKICGVELSDRQRQALNEGRTLYIRNMTDKDGQSFNAYVRYDQKENRPRFYRWNPDRKQEQGEAKVEAAAEVHKTQAAVNNAGRTNETTKDLKEPLKSGQQPDEYQKKEQQLKNRGRKM